MNELLSSITEHIERTIPEFHEEYSKVINQFTRSFTNEYCDTTGAIMWDKLVNLSSSKI